MALRRSTGLKNKLLGLVSVVNTNPYFESSTTGWTATNASASVANGIVTLTNTNSGNKGTLSQTISLKVGRLYAFTAVLKAGTASCSVTVSDGSNTYVNATVTATNAFTTVNSYFISQATSATVIVTVESTSVDDNCYIDSVAITDIATGFKQVFNNSKIEIRTGSQPSSADLAPTGTLLVTITLNGDSGTGLVFDDPSNGTVGKPSGAVWSGTAVATGTAGWFRLCHMNDSGAQSTTEERIDGSVAISGADLNMSSTNIVVGSVHVINQFNISIS